MANPQSGLAQRIRFDPKPVFEARASAAYRTREAMTAAAQSQFSTANALP
jgi:hypothetical protein